MAEAIGTAVIEVVADARKLRAGIEDAKKSLRTLGEGQKDISKGASQSIDRYIGSLQAQNATVGMSARKVELYKLALRGASNEQLKLADSALLIADANKKLGFSWEALRANAVKAGLAIGAALSTIAVAMGAVVKSNIDFADSLNDLSKSTNISVEDLAGLSLLAKQTGTDLGGLASGINKMSVAIGKDPGKFKELGVTAKDSLGQFKQLADIFNSLPDINQRNALAQKVFNKSWQELAPALAEGSAGIDRAVAKGKELSGITKENAERADEFKDKLEELKIASAGVGLQLLPALISITNRILAATQATGGLLSGLRSLAILKTGAFGEGTEEQLKQIEAAEKRTTLLKRFTPEFLTGGLVSVREQGLKELRATVEAQEKLVTPELGSHLTPEQDTAAELARIKAAREAPGRAKKFLEEKKEGAGGPSAAEAARQEAKAQLAFDLEQIKKTNQAQIEGFSNAQNIMEAMRSADLVSDKDYYASKLGFIKLNSQAQEAALQQQIERLQQEGEIQKELSRQRQAELTGKSAAKERIAEEHEAAKLQLENDRKILDVQAQLTKARAEATTNIKINAIQEVAANKKVQQSLIDATEAANQYIDSIKKRNQLELAGIGRGEKFREQLAAISEIEGKRDAERQRIARDRRNNPQIDPKVWADYLRTAEDTYNKEIALYHERTAALSAAEADWVNGANRALENYIDETKNVAKQTEEAWTSAFKGLEDELLEFTKTGKFNFKKLADSIISDLNRMFIKQNITGPLAEMMKGGIGAPGAAAGGGGDLFAPLKALFGFGKPAAAEAKVEDDWPDLLKEGSKATEQQIDTITVATEATAKLSAQTLSQVTSSITTETALATLATAALSAATALQTMAASSAASSGSSLLGGASGLFTGDEFDLLGELQSGINYVPETGIYKLHEGERVVPKSQNNAGMGGGVVIYQSFAPGTDTRTVNQAAAATGMQFRRAMARNT